MRLTTTIFSLAILAAMVAPASAQTAEELEQRSARMEWWREARFGLFIHWGVYSVPAGVHEGRQIGGLGEWIMRKASIPPDAYRQYAAQFDPVKYDPEAWVLLAKAAGMRYIVITAKHHDGFALFDSKVTDWDVVDATPYGKDLLEPLAAACHKHDIKLGFYYSQAQDWYHRGTDFPKFDPTAQGNMDEYIRDIAVPQVKEILSNYGPVAVLWWDTPFGMNAARAAQFTPLAALQPGIIVNNRLSAGTPGDFATPEQKIPGEIFRELGRDWEVCMTMNDTWGYKHDDNNWKPPAVIIRNLVDIASKGGNFLLNVGPKADGTIPPQSIELLREIGAWMSVNARAIYDTEGGPASLQPAWGRCTQRFHGDGTTLYLHVFDWPADGKLEVSGLTNKVRHAYLLAEPLQWLSTEATETGVRIGVRPTAPDSISSTVVIEVEDKV